MLIRHPLTLLTEAIPAIELSPSHTALLLQDLHAPFGDPQAGHLARYARAKVLLREFDDYYDGLALATPQIVAVTARARGLGLPVIYSSLGYYAPDSPSPFQQATGWRWELAGEDGRFPEAWAPQPGDAHFAKAGWSACGNPAFVEALKARQIRSLLVMGTMMEYGIRQSCADLCDHGIQPLVVADGVVALTAVGRAYSSGALAHGMTKLRSTGELLDLLAVMAQQGRVLV